MARAERLICGLGLFLLAACGGSGGTAPAVTTPPPAGGGGGGPVALTGPPGARSFKSGPIQITADGATVWVANPDNDSVSRIDTATDAVTEFVLPDPATRDEPRGVSVTEDGREVWVACHDSDRVYVLRGSDGVVLARIDLPWGSGPHGIALSRDQTRALVTLYRRGAVAELEVASRSVARILGPVWRTPHGVVWLENGTTAWVAHVFADGEHTRMTRIEYDAGVARVAGEITVFASDPRQSSRLAAPADVAEGGYLTPRGHPAQRPGRAEVWIPMQYNNITEDRYTPDSTIQTTIRRLETDTLALPNTNDTKVILSALHAHDPAGSNPLEGPGWNANVSGPIDIAFSAAGTLSYLVCEQSNDLVIVPTATTNVRPAGSPGLAEIPVGARPMGVAVSPVEGAAYVMNRYSRSVSVVDIGGERELRQIPITPVTGEPFTAQFLKGAMLFHTSADPRLSGNGKVACASCHVDAEIDGRGWAFHRLAGRAGPRPTLTIRGLGRHFGPRDPASGFGQLHRSGDRDEVQDFEHTIQGELMGGAGFLGAQVQPALGAPNAGRDPDLDALAHYSLNLDPIARSPHRAANGALTEAAVRGAAHFLASGCAQCHVPETAFVDFRFHDVGSNRMNNEEELNHSSRGAWQWKVNTKTLVGLWATPGYEGVATFADDIEKFLDDIGQRTTHGDITGLNGQQRRDLAAFLLSIDGNTTAAEVRNARDTTPPRVVRAEPASLTRIDVWFSEPVAQASAENTANWQVPGATVTAATWDAQNGDRVTLTVQLASNTAYTVIPGPVTDTATPGNALDTTDPRNTRGFVLGTELTITLGSSGYENLSIPVHDAAFAGANLSTWSHDTVWLFTNGGQINQGFVRFEWQNTFLAETGVTTAADIVTASFRLEPETGHRHPVEIRRCLKPWSDPATGGDWNQNATGGPTWRDHSHPSGRWNQAGARRRTNGIDGTDPSQYDGPNDTANQPDAVAQVRGINEPVEFAGAAVTDAFRFWFDNPGVDYGYALSFAPNAHRAGLKFQRAERRAGPVLEITYRLP